MAEVNLNTINTRVASISPADADADVRLEITEHGPEFVFSFKLPAGEKGKDGTNVIGIVLTDESALVPCLDDGTPDPDLDEHASTRIILKDGDTTISDGVSYGVINPSPEVEVEVDDYGYVNVILSKESPEQVDIKCLATYKRIQHEKTYTVKKAIGTPVYKILPDVGAVKQDGNLIEPENLRIDVTKWNGKEWVLSNLDKTVYYNCEIINGENSEIKTGLVADLTCYDEDTCEWSIKLTDAGIWKSLNVYVTEDDTPGGVKVDSQSVSFLKDGIGIITANAYTVVPSNWDISNYTVSGGNYYNIKDDSTYSSLLSYDEEGNLADLDWSPTNSNIRNDNQTVWMISQVFSSLDEQKNEDHLWSHPIKLQDSDVFQVEYSANESETPPSPIQLENLIANLVSSGIERDTLTSEVLEQYWREAEAEKDNPWVWGDEITDPKWMATSRYQNGAWSKWTVTKVRGDVGYNALQLELSNEVDWVPCVTDINGNYIPDEDIEGPLGSTDVVLMDGHTNITQTCQISIECTDQALGRVLNHLWENFQYTDDDGNVYWEFIVSEDGTYGTFNVYKINEDLTKFTITLTYVSERHKTPIEYTGTYKIIKAKNATVYKIVPNVTAVKIDSAGNANPNSIIIDLLKWNGQKYEQINLTSDNYLSYGFDVTCSGKSNYIQENSVSSIPALAIDFVDGKCTVNIEDDVLWKNGLPGEFTFSIPILSEGEQIGTEKESVPVISDGINVAGVYEYYAKNNDVTMAPTLPEGFPRVNDGKKWTDELLKTDLGIWCYNSPPKLSINEQCLWNIEVITNSWGDVVNVTDSAMIGKYGADGMSPYAIMEFYDIDDSAPEDEQDSKKEYIYVQNAADIPIPTSEYPYLYGFERVLYGKEGYEFNDTSVFYDSHHKCILKDDIVYNDVLVGKDDKTDKEMVEEGLIKFVDTPIALVSKIGAGSFTEQIYKFVAKGKSSKEKLEDKHAVLSVPSDSVGNYEIPGPGYDTDTWDQIEDWLGWSDGIPEVIYDWDGNLIKKDENGYTTDYDPSVHGGKVLYMSLRTYTTDGKSPQTGWRPATVASDVEGKVDFEWSSQESEPLPPDIAPAGTWGNSAQTNSIWMAVRHMGADGAWEEWTISKIKGEKGDKGDDALHLELSNDFTMVATDSDGNVLTGWDEDTEDGQNDVDIAMTEAQVFFGTKNVTNECSFEWIITPDNKGTRAEGETGAKFSLHEMNADALVITCVATYGTSSVTKDFNILKSKGQDVYKLVPSGSFFTYATEESSTAEPETISFAVSKWFNGQYTTVEDLSAEGLSIYVGDTDISAFKEINANKFPQTVSLRKGITLLDQETIGYVVGGQNGRDAIHLELSNDFTMVATDSQGNVYSSWDEDKSDSDQDIAVTEAQVFCGNTDVTSACTWNWTMFPNDGGRRQEGQEGHKFSLVRMDVDELLIACTATYDGLSITKNFNVLKSKGQDVYKILPSANYFYYPHNDSESIIPEQIDFVVTKWANGVYVTVDPNVEGLVLSNSSIYPIKDIQTVTLKKEGVVIDQETIGYVVGGKDGKDGDSVLHVELSNDFTMVATDSEGRILSGWDDDTSDTDQDFAMTEAQVFYGNTNVTDECLFDWIISPPNGGQRQSGETGSKFSLVSMDSDTVTATCIVTYKNMSMSKDFSILKSKGQDVYKLVPSDTLFLYTDTNSNVAIPETITMSVYKWANGSYYVVDDLMNEGLTLSHTSINASKTPTTVTLKKGDVVIDQETIGYVVGGRDGVDPVHIELSNDFTMVATDSNGNIVSGWDEDPGDSDQDIAVTEAQVFCGTQNVTNNASISWHMTPSDGGTRQADEAENSQKFSLVGMSVDSLVITCTVNYNGVTLTKDFNVLKSKGQDVYKIIPSAQLFSYPNADATVASPTSISVSVSKWSNGQYTIIDPQAEGLTLSASSLSAKKESQVVTLKKGNILLDQETIGYVVGGKDGNPGTNGRGISSITKTYAINDDASTHPSSFSSSNPIATTSANRYCWCKEVTLYTDNSSNTIYYIVTVHGETGATGAAGGTGAAGPVIYSAGVWSSSKTYQIEDNKQPYVYLLTDASGNETAKSDRYWKLKVASSQGQHPMTNSQHWEKMPYFEAVYADAGAFNQALVGSFVFNGEHMYSQNGVNGNYDTVNDPSNVNSWIPNAYINAKTGAAWFAGGKAKFNQNGSWRLGGNSTYINCDTSGKVTLSGIILSWNQINAPSDLATTGDINNATSNLISSDEDLSQYITSIDGSKIKTGTLDTNRLTTNSLNALKADIAELAADKISVKSLNTTPSSDNNIGRILIKDNQMDVYNATSNDAILTISGTTSTVKIPGFKEFSAYGSVTSYTYSGYGGYVYTTSNNIWSYNDHGSLYFDPSYDYKVTWPEVKSYASIIYSNGTYGPTECSIGGGHAFVLIPSAYVSDVNNVVKKLSNSQLSYCAKTTYEDIKGVNNTIYLYDGNQFNSVGSNFKVPSPGYYYLYSVYVIYSGSSVTVSSYEDPTNYNIQIGFSVSLENTASIRIEPSCKKTLITGNGLQYICSADKYFSVDSETGEIIMRHGNYMLKISSAGIQKSSSGGTAWTTL